LAGSLTIAFAAVVAFALSELVHGLVSEIFLLSAASGISLAEFEEVAGSLTIAIAVVAASGEETALSNEVEGAGAPSEELAGWAVVALSAAALSFIALAVMTAVDVQAEILGLASVSEEALRTLAFAFNAGTTVLAVNVVAEVLGLASVSLPASSALAESVVAFATVLAINIKAKASGLTLALALNAGSLAVALAVVEASGSAEGVL